MLESEIRLFMDNGDSRELTGKSNQTLYEYAVCLGCLLVDQKRELNSNFPISCHFSFPMIDKKYGHRPIVGVLPEKSVNDSSIGLSRGSENK